MIGSNTGVIQPHILEPYKHFQEEKALIVQDYLQVDALEFYIFHFQYYINQSMCSQISTVDLLRTSTLKPVLAVTYKTPIVKNMKDESVMDWRLSWVHSCLSLDDC